MQRYEVAQLRRSWACTRTLTEADADRVLAELEQCLQEREEVIAALDELAAGPWPDVRRLLGRLHAVLHPPRR